MTQPSARLDSPKPFLLRMPHRAMPLIHAVVAIGLFANVLAQRNLVVGQWDADSRTQYLPWRAFAFDQIRHGHIPLWNPHSFAGTPFVGDPQSVMFYPLNWVHLLLPPVFAFNLLVAVHVFLAMWLMGLWCRSRGISVVGSTLAGIVYVCSGPSSTNWMAGHIAVACSVAWLPLLAMSVDGVFSALGTSRPSPRRLLGWMLVGAAVVALLALDGYPQFSYDSALAMGLWILLRLFTTDRGRCWWRAILALMVVWIGGAGLASVQILSSMDVAGQSIRAAGLSYEMAKSFPLPWQNLLTLIAGGVYGDNFTVDYWGVSNFWESNAFIGIAALALAAYAVLRSSRRGYRWVALFAGVMLLLALGDQTPIFSWLYRWLPGFNHFRAANRFDLLGMLFLSLLVGHGADELLTNLSTASSRQESPRDAASQAADLALASERRLRTQIACVLFGLAVPLLVAAAWALSQASSPDSAFVNWIFSNRKLTTPYDQIMVRNLFGPRAAQLTAGQLFIAALWAGAVAWLLWVGHRRRWAAPLLLAVCAGQGITFAASERINSEWPYQVNPSWTSTVEQHRHGGNRLICSDSSLIEAGCVDGFDNATGYNPLTLFRTTQFLDATEGQDYWGEPVFANRLPPIFRMLRADTLLGNTVQYLDHPLPHGVLVGSWSLANSDGAALQKIVPDARFDPASVVVLESPPDPLPRPGPTGTAGRVVVRDIDTDSMEITADVPSPQILLITDAYATGWHAAPLDPSPPQPAYQVLPADFMLRAIPLAAGHHHFLLFYRPRLYAIGLTITLATLALYLALLLAWAISARHRPAKVGVLQAVG